MGTGRRGLAGSTAAPNSLSVAFGGSTGSESAATEEFTGETSSVNIEDFTTS